MQHKTDNTHLPGQPTSSMPQTPQIPQSASAILLGRRRRWRWFVRLLNRNTQRCPRFA